MIDLWAASSGATFGGRFVRIFTAGSVGLLASVPAFLKILSQRSPTEFANLLGLEVVVWLLPLAFAVFVAAALGAGLAPRVGLRSQIAEGEVEGGSWWVAAVVWGLLVGVSFVGLDRLFESYPYLQAAGPFRNSPAGVLSALFQGGLSQEIFLRWCLLTLFAWLGWRLFQGGQGLPNATVMAFAVLLSGLASLAGPLLHLVQTQIGNDRLLADVAFRYGLSSLVFGVLYWRYNLEAAMVAHASALLVTTIVGVAPL